MPHYNYNRRRFRPILEPQDTCYMHVVSRVVNRDYILDAPEKEQFLSLMRRYEAFGKLRVVGWVIMSNHFHILVEATGRPEERPSEESLVEHVEATLGQTVADQYRWRLDLCRAGKLEDDARQAKLAEDDADAAAEWIPTYHQLEFDKVLADIWRRMYDVSCFVQSLKQQFYPSCLGLSVVPAA